MADSEPKKLSLKERMALKKKTSTASESFVPGGDNSFTPPAQEYTPVQEFVPQQPAPQQDFMFQQPAPQPFFDPMQQQAMQFAQMMMQYGYWNEMYAQQFLMQPVPQQQQMMQLLQMQMMGGQNQGFFAQYEEGEYEEEEEEEPEEQIDFDEYMRRVEAGEIDASVSIKKPRIGARIVRQTDDDKKPVVQRVKKVVIKNEKIVDIMRLRNNKDNEGKFFGEKEAMNIIIIGHVDSGKSTICGNMLIRSGKVDEGEFRKYEQEAAEKGRESWIYAYVMDINEEERDKGKTVEVGKAQFELANTRYTILDCPGHKNYVPNMIDGVAQADVAALVVSAKSGEFEAGFEKAGQTREHAILASNMGNSTLVVIVNKMDECEWDIERYNYIQKNLTPFLIGTCGYTPGQIIWVPCSGYKGINIDSRVSTEECPWYNGPSLFETLDCLPKVQRIKRNCLRIPVFDAFREQGNLIVFGKVESGVVEEGMNVVLMPSRKSFQVTKIFDNEDKEVVLAESGENIKFFAKGIEVTEIKKGNVICGRQYLCHVADTFEAKIRVMCPPDNKILSNGFRAILHLHTIQMDVSIKKVKSNDTENKTTGFLCLKHDQEGTVIIQTEVPICVEKFEEFPELARFSLRAESSTIAVGKVLRVKPIAKEEDHTDYYKFMKIQAEKAAKGEPTEENKDQQEQNDTNNEQEEVAEN